MLKYWTKNRMFPDILIPVALLLAITIAFIVPLYETLGEVRLAKSIYENEKLNFDIPSPSFSQISQLESKNAIVSVFPYFYTKINLTVDGKKRETNLFFSDTFDKLDQTMYCKSRLIENGNELYSNPILVDYRFVQDTGAKIGSIVSVTIGVTKIDFQVAAIYETNIYYDGGAVMAKWEGLQKDAITNISPKVVYSGAYVQAADYQQCKSYLETQYKPYGRLKDRSEFATQEAYDMHYNVFMSANYANEITDFTVKKQDAFSKVKAKENTVKLYTLMPIVILTISLIIYNLLMWLRKSEKGYFSRKNMSGGRNLTLYYLISILVQAAIIIGGTIIVIFVTPLNVPFYIPSSAIMSKSVVFIAAVACISVIVAIEDMVLLQKTKH